MMPEATAREIEAAARIVACLRCLRRSRAYDFTRHVEIERLFALLANAMGLAGEGLYVFLDRGQLVHPYPVHILAKRVDAAPKRPYVGQTEVIVEFRDKDDKSQPLTREKIETMLAAGSHGTLDVEEAWTDPRFGDRIVSEILWEHATPLWSQLPRDEGARVAQFAWAALRFDQLQQSEAFSRSMAKLRGEDPDEVPLGAIEIQPWPNAERVTIELIANDSFASKGPKIVAKRSDLRDAVGAVSLVWPVRVLDRVLAQAAKLEPKVRKRPRVLRFDVLKKRGRATLTEQLAYWLVEAPAGPRFSIEEARDALGMKSRQAVWRALRDGRKKQPRPSAKKPEKQRRR